MPQKLTSPEYLEQSSGQVGQKYRKVPARAGVLNGSRRSTDVSRVLANTEGVGCEGF